MSIMLYGPPRTLDVPRTGSKYSLVSKWEHDDQMFPVLTRHTCLLTY